jgi:hypothetical protein
MLEPFGPFSGFGEKALEPYSMLSIAKDAMEKA